MITCRELLSFLDDYLDGSIPAGQKRVFDEHLKVCPPCVTYLRTYEDSIALARGSAAAEPCEPIPDELTRAVLEARRRG